MAETTRRRAISRDPAPRHGTGLYRCILEHLVRRRLDVRLLRLAAIRRPQQSLISAAPVPASIRRPMKRTTSTGPKTATSCIAPKSSAAAADATSATSLTTAPHPLADAIASILHHCGFCPEGNVTPDHQVKPDRRRISIHPRTAEMIFRCRRRDKFAPDKRRCIDLGCFPTTDGSHWVPGQHSLGLGGFCRSRR